MEEGCFLEYLNQKSNMAIINNFHWDRNRLKAIMENYGGNSFFVNKKVLDLGTGNGGIAGQLHRMGAHLTCVDARQENLSALQSQYPDLKTMLVDLDSSFPFNEKFDIALSLGILCHLKNWEQHLKDICSIADCIVLETAVLDSNDPNLHIHTTEDRGSVELSFNGTGSIPSSANIQRVLDSFGASYRRIDKRTINSGQYHYDWKEINSNTYDIGQRRIWFITQHKLHDKLFESNRQIRSAQEAAPPPNILRNPPPQTKAFAMAIKPPPQFNERLTMRERLARKEEEKAIHSRPSISLMGGARKFVIVVPSYNNERWCEENIKTALAQNYNKYRIIFTDDNSTDGTFNKVRNVVEASGKATKCTLIKNERRMGALTNLYTMIHSCADDEIVLTLDGDDWFPDGDVLNKLDRVYASRDVWITYGQYQNSNDGGRGVAKPYAQHVIDSNGFRTAEWGASHLRTFYSWLFKSIRKEDLMYNGEFLQMTWDLGFMLPMLEMAGTHSKYVNDILYVYNLDNPINDHKVNRNMQASLDRYVRTLPRYKRVQAPSFHNPKVGLIMIATGKYDRYLQGMISSADSYFMKDISDVSYFVFSDKENSLQSSRPINNINIEHRDFPYSTLDRYKHFTINENVFRDMNYLFYVDVDCLFVDKVGEDILGDLVAVRHCGYVHQPGPFENNQSSQAYIPQSSRGLYFGGGMQGGLKEIYLQAAKECYDMTERDLKNGIMPIWHDESIWNKYCSINVPDVILSPSYHYPQGHINDYKRKWAPLTFEPKLLLLEKNHQEVRS